MSKQSQITLGCIALSCLGAWMLFSAAVFHFTFSGDIATTQASVEAVSARKCTIDDLCGKVKNYIVSHELSFKTQSGEDISANWDSRETYSRSEVEVGQSVEVHYLMQTPSENYVGTAGGRDRTPHKMGKMLPAIALLLGGMFGLLGYNFLFRKD